MRHFLKNKSKFQLLKCLKNIRIVEILQALEKRQGFWQLFGGGDAQNDAVQARVQRRINHSNLVHTVYRWADSSIPDRQK